MIGKQRVSAAKPDFVQSSHEGLVVFGFLVLAFFLPALKLIFLCRVGRTELSLKISNNGDTIHGMSQTSAFCQV